MRLFIICYYGNEIEHNSEEFLCETYKTKWIDSDKGTRKNVLIIQENLKKPLTIFVAKFLTVNIEVFMNVMKAAYSVFAVLQQIKK